MARDVEFDITGSDKTAAALRAAERNFARTNEKIKKEQKRTGDLLGSGLLGSIDKVAPKLAESIATSAAQAGKLGGPALAGALALSAPAIGAVISGAIIGAAGVGGVIGGVMLVSRDPRVAAAGKVLGSNLMSGLESDAQVFIAPVLSTLDKVGDFAEQRLRPRLRNIFADSAGFLDPLVDGALDGVDGITAGIESLVDRAGPVIDALGEAFSRIGRDAGEAMEIISGGSDDAADSIRAVGIVIGESLIISGRFLRLLTEIFGFMVKLQDSIGDVIPQLDFFGEKSDKAAEGQRQLGSGTFGATQAIDAEKASAAELAVSLEDAERAVRDVHQAQLDLYSSTTNVADAVARASEQIDENGRTLSLNSEKGRENRDALATVAGALQRQYDAYVKVNGVGAGSAAVADNLRGKFIALARQAGASASKAQELADKILAIPSKKEARITASTAQAKADIQAVKASIDRVRSKTVTVTVQVNTARLEKVNRQLARAGGGRGAMTAADYWSSANVNAGTARTGGPTPVAVTSDVVVNLDGRPFYQASVQAAQRVSDRAAWRQKVGKR